MSTSPTIVVAGGSGYIGKALIVRLLEKFPRAQIIALARTKQESKDPRIQWKSCDLFSLESIESSLPASVDVAIYLVHSMGPTAQLDQGSFADYDLILADNFARAIKKTKIKQLIYLGGIIPNTSTLSLHLQSRLEVEETFLEHGLPTTIFRAGLILGEAGSSFQILIKLVRRLPVMLCPKWTQTLTTPVDLDTALTEIMSSVSETKHVGKIYDLAGCEPLTYIEMMNLTSQAMGLKRFFVGVPFFTPTLSRLWVSMITNTPKDLVYPLIESLEHPMVARGDHLFPRERVKRTYSDLLKGTSLQSKPGLSFFRFRAKRNTVRSVQRLPLSSGKDAVWVKNLYFHWLPRFLSFLIHVKQEKELIVFSVVGWNLRLLELRYDEGRSDRDSQLLYVVGGLLVHRENQGRLEFRVVLGRRHVIAAIHDFRPSLPWFIYKYTQALLHLYVMMAFKRFLMRPPR